MKKLLIILSGLALAGCGGGGGSSTGGSPGPAPDPQTLTSLGVAISAENGPLVNGSIDAREFAIDPVINVTYTNNEAFPVVLRTDTNFPSSPDCGIPNVGNICPQIVTFPDYGKYPNQCNSFTGQTTTLQAGQSCIQSFRVINGWNFTNSEKFSFTDNSGYTYYNANQTTQTGSGKINLSVLVGITQNLGDVGGYNYNMRMLPTPDANYFYRIIPNTDGTLGKYQITYDDINHSATLNKTPIATIPVPFHRTAQTSLVGIANSGDPIGVYQDSTPNILNYVNSLEYGIGSPEILNGYDDMFVGLDGNNYTVNGTNSGGNVFTGNTIATFSSGASTLTNLGLPRISGNYLVTKEGNIVYSGSQQYCYMKANNYSQQAINLGNAPSWVDLSSTVHDIYVIGNNVYMGFNTHYTGGYWFKINGSDCSIDWSDARTLMLNSYPGSVITGIYTINNRVLYGIWDTGRVLYYPYPPRN